MVPRRRHYQQYGPQTIILLGGPFFLLTALKCVPENSNGLLWAVMGLFLMNAGCSLFGEKKEMEKAPQRRRGNGEYDPISESCACLNILHLRRRPGKYLGSVTIADFRFFQK